MKPQLLVSAARSRSAADLDEADVAGAARHPGDVVSGSGPAAIRSAQSMFHANEEAARTLGLEALVLKVERGAANPDFDGAFAKAKQEGAGAVVVLSTPVTTPNRWRIAEAAIKHRIAILSPREHADSGALMSFGTAFSEATRAVATHVDKILKGARAGELPVDAIKRHELVLNVKTAREIGLTLPLAVLRSANQVID